MTTRSLQTFVRFKPVTILLSPMLVIGVGVFDYVTGRNIAVTPLYLLPICWAGWVLGRRVGMLLAGLGAGAWLMADWVMHYTYPFRGIPYWNALMLLVIFAVVVYLLTAFHDAHEHLEETVAQRTATLRKEIAERKRLEAARIQSERLAAVGSMASKLAHEIRNPLGTVKLNLDLLGDEVGALGPGSPANTDEAKTLLGAIHWEVRRIQQLAEDYLQFGRLPKLRCSPVSVKRPDKPGIVVLAADVRYRPRPGWN